MIRVQAGAAAFAMSMSLAGLAVPLLLDPADAAHALLPRLM